MSENFTIPLFLLGALLVVSPASGADRNARSMTDQLIVRLEQSSLRRIQSVRANEAVPDVRLNGQALTFVRRFNGNGIIVRLPRQVSLEEARSMARQLENSEGIASAQPDRRMYPALFPNDPLYPQQWHLFEDTAGIRVPAAWDRETGSSAVIIAALDTGILPHADLDPARILPGYDFISDVATANDGDGRDPDPTDPGDAVEADECNIGELAEPSSWHGLAVSGVMVAKSDNASLAGTAGDIAGIDFAARLLPVRVLGKCGGFVSDIIDAMRWTAGLPVTGVPANMARARVINLSLSGPGACSPDEQQAINDVVAEGVVVVVAAGNDSADTAGQSPANCANVIAVGAVARDGKRASYVNAGDEVDLSAPGGDGPDGILTLYNTGTVDPGFDATAVIQGTSFAAAQVSAVASLMFAIDSSLAPGTVADYLRRSARVFPDDSCTTCTCGQGVLDADAALAAAADPATLPASNFVSPSCVVDGASGGGGGGGSGCVLASRPAPFDPVLLVLLVVAAVSRRKRST